MTKQLEIHDTWNGIVRTWGAVQKDHADAEAWANFMLLCDRLSALARELDLLDLFEAVNAIACALSSASDYDGVQFVRVQNILPAVFEQVRIACSGTLSPRDRAKGTSAALVVLVADDTDGMRDILLRLDHFGFRFELIEDLREGVAYALVHHAAGVVVDLKFVGDETGDLALANLAQAGIKWVAMTERGGFDSRLSAIRRGAEGFLQAPLSVEALVDVLDSLTVDALREPYRVLVIDDSPTVLASLEKMLLETGQVVVRPQSQIDDLIEVLIDFAPDVIVLDYYLENCLGTEVARVIRQIKSFDSIPIVYLTSETSVDIEYQAMRSGGDDYLQKPVSQSQLWGAVVGRAERYRALRRLMVEDSLTGLFNHVKTKALLQQMLLQGERSKMPVSYAIIDIDHFKRVNDTYGHAVGDSVIRTLARFLKKKMRRSDVVGRYGGEEFALVLYDANVEQAKERLDVLRRGFSEIFHAYDEGIFAVTFSAGVAEYPSYLGAIELMAAADSALYVAKQSGRNRVVCAPNSVSGGGANGAAD